MALKTSNSVQNTIYVFFIVSLSSKIRPLKFYPDIMGLVHTLQLPISLGVKGALGTTAQLSLILGEKCYSGNGWIHQDLMFISSKVSFTNTILKVVLSRKVMHTLMLLSGFSLNTGL